MSSEFVHLHVHSHYSLLDGLAKIEDILTRVEELGMKAIALTDHGNMYGALEFYQQAKERGIQPILGVEAYVAPQGHTQKRGKIDLDPRHLTLLAQSLAGYQNLLKLTTAAHVEGFYSRPRIDYPLLKHHQDGLIVLSGCMNSDISQAILKNRLPDAEKLIAWHIDTFGRDRFYLEVQHHPNIPEQGVLNTALFELAKKFSLKVVATGDTHYVRAEDAEAQDVLVCVQTQKTVQDKDRLCMLGEDFSIQSPEQLAGAWKEHPEVMEQTLAIAEQCQVELQLGVQRLPRYPLPAKTTTDQELRALCEKGLAVRYGSSLPEGARERLDYELQVIQKTGFASYFLIVSDFVNEAKRRGILVGPGRGSAAGSLVSYLTNITNLDPLHYNLLFERFLNPQRISMPDIDLDFADDRRDEVIEYVRQKYGREYVAQIITFGTMAARAAIRDAGRALGYPYAFCDTLAKQIPPFTNFEQALATGSELRQTYDGDPQAKRLIDTARRLEGVVRHASTHAAGVVIGDRPLVEYVPLQYAVKERGEKQQTMVTQFAMGPIEALGLLKMDFLGLKNLTIIQTALRLIRERHKTEIVLDKLPLDDAKAYRLLQAGQTTGVFQLESAGMKRYLRELKPTELEDIISMVALYRPGPMDSIPDFIAAKHGRKTITYLHPLLAPILEKTYGVIVTQDQVLQIAREFAGFSYAEADILRKAVGKKIKALLIEQREKFITGAVENKGIHRTTAKKVWDFIEPFARYGFNRAHAACYAMIAYQTAYLKANYQADFMAALLTSDEGNTDRQAIEVAEAVSLRLKVLPPDVNESGENFTVVADDAIRFGLGAIKNVGTNAVHAIIQERKKHGSFKDFSDILRRIPHRDLNKKALESLAKAGALDRIAERAQVLENVESILQFSRSVHQTQDRGQKNLFGRSTVALALPSVSLRPVPAAAKAVRLAWERELLGLYVSEHPLSELATLLQQAVTSLSDLYELGQAGARSRRATWRVAGVITRITKIITKNQQAMLFVQIEDMTAKTEILVFPNLLQRSSDVWQDGAGVVIEGKLSDKEGEIKILADKVWRLTAEVLQEFSQKSPVARPAARGGILSVHVPRTFTRLQMARLKEKLQEFHTTDGLVPVEILIPLNGGFRKITTPFRVSQAETVHKELARLIHS